MTLKITHARFPGERVSRKLPVPIEVPTDGSPLVVPAPPTERGLNHACAECGNPYQCAEDAECWRHPEQERFG